MAGFFLDNTTWMPNGTTESLAPSSGGMSKLTKIKIAVQSVILYLALFGNSVVLLVLKCRKPKLTRMQWFIVHLCLTDIFVAIFNTMTQLIQDINGGVFVGNDFSCRFVKYFQVVAMYASSYVLIMTAIDRYISICHPLISQTMNPNRPHLMVLGAWVLSLVFSIPQMIIFKYIYERGRWNCSSSRALTENWTYQAYTTWIFVSIYAVPFCILAFCYGRICHVVWSSSKAQAAHQPLGSRRLNSTKGPMWKISFKKNTNSTVPPNQDDLLKRNSINPKSFKKSMSKSKVKTIKVTLSVVICYLLCWAPWFTAMMWWAYDTNAPSSAWAFHLIVLLAALNSCTNPWIYLFFTGNVCSKRETKRRVSRSWTASTHITSMYDSDSRSRSGRSSYYDMSQRSSRDLTTSICDADSRPKSTTASYYEIARRDTGNQASQDAVSTC
ncbi:hypothetical protein LOTGIDRAFT_140457 [Lottia gigantea]|uniref:G-protein coupled receptors family 1 profile domain-containing protein n=1 Tax=Lottia gigantea TaxID=225164 RepID=V4B0T6_LOTGI|nr:hypothetical protein LOTGIDRAFT_140457 [Lottia gigantea]ESP00851.1 hypothetical protein LOTGIDRAFT_140457 [Lottia gigantea]